MMAVMQYFQIRSAYLFAGLAVTGLVAIYSSEISVLVKGRPQTTVDFWTGYILLGAANVLLGVEAVTSVGDAVVRICMRRVVSDMRSFWCFRSDPGHLRTIDRQVRDQLETTSRSRMLTSDSTSTEWAA
jgi:hypothetical protein